MSREAILAVSYAELFTGIPIPPQTRVIAIRHPLHGEQVIGIHIEGDWLPDFCERQGPFWCVSWYRPGVVLPGGELRND